MWRADRPALHTVSVRRYRICSEAAAQHAMGSYAGTFRCRLCHIQAISATSGGSSRPAMGVVE